jgi:hypothetical protein
MQLKGSMRAIHSSFTSCTQHSTCLPAGIDTACQPKHYREDLVGQALGKLQQVRVDGGVGQFPQQASRTQRAVVSGRVLGLLVGQVLGKLQQVGVAG